MTTKKTTKKPAAKKKATRKKLPTKFQKPAETSHPAPAKPGYNRGRKDADEVLLAQRQRHGKDMHKALMLGVLQLNENIITRLVIAFESGHHTTSAVKSIGVPLPKFRAWMEKGVRDAENYELIIAGGGKIAPKDTSLEYQLLVRLNTADFTFEDMLLGKVVNADSWQAHMAILAKRYPGRWGDKSTVEINQTSTTTHVFMTPREATIDEWQAEQQKIADGTHYIDEHEVHETGGEKPSEGEDI